MLSPSFPPGHNLPPTSLLTILHLSLLSTQYSEEHPSAIYLRSIFTSLTRNMPSLFHHRFSNTKMSELSRSDIKALALSLCNDPTRLDADHNKIRSLTNNIPNHLQDFRFSSILPETRHAFKPCPVHDGIAPLVVSRLFNSVKNQVDESVPLLERYGPYLGPEETFILEKMITIEGMWSPPTARKGSTKIRYWDYQVDKCQACMVSRVASDAAALRDMRTLILSSIDSSVDSSDPRLLPNHPTILSFINEWISLSSRADELFYWSGIQSASIKEAKRMVEETRTATPKRSGCKNFSYPQPPRSDHTSTDSSLQSQAIFTPTRTPESSTSSKNSSNFEWPLLKRYRLPGSTSTITPAQTLRCDPAGGSFSSQSSNCAHFLPPKQPCTQLRGAFSTANSHVPTSPYSAHCFLLHEPVDRDARTTPRPRANPEDEHEHDRPNSANSSRSSHASFMSYIRRAALSASSPPSSPLPPFPPCQDLPRPAGPIPRWESPGVDLAYRPSPALDGSFLLANTSNNGGQELLRGQHRTQLATNATIAVSEQREAEAQEYDQEALPISRWSTASSVHTWSTLLKKARGPRLGKVKTGRAIFKAGSAKDVYKKRA